MDIIKAFETARAGKLVRHPSLLHSFYGYQYRYGQSELYEVHTGLPLIISEDLFFDWKKVTKEDIINYMEWYKDRGLNEHS